MSTIKNGRISLYCHFNKIIKDAGTSFQSPALIPKHVRNVCNTRHQSLTKFYFDSTLDSKEISVGVTLLCSNAYDDVIDFKICAFHKNTKIQISRKQSIFLEIITFINYTSIAGLDMTRGRQPAPALSPAQIKKKEAWAGDEKPAQRQSCVS